VPGNSSLAGRSSGGGTRVRRFYFDLVEGNQVFVDFEGQFLAGLAAARAAAIETIRDVLAEATRHGLISLDGLVRIRGSGAQVLAIVAFSEAVSVVSAPALEWEVRRSRAHAVAS
jgi:hypothetical protein